MNRIRWLWELLIAVSVFVIGVYGLLESLKMPRGTPHDSPGLTPSVLSIILMTLSVGMMIYLFVLRKRTGKVEDRTDEDRDLEKVRTKRLILFIALTLTYVALLGKIPYVLATFLYLVVSYLCFKSVRFYVAIAIAALVSFGLMYSFGTLLAVRLP